MSYVFNQPYENCLAYAGAAVTVQDASANVLGSGTIHASGFGSISATVGDTFNGPIYLVKTSDSARIGADVFDYRNLPDNATIADIETAVAALTPNGGSGAWAVYVQTNVAGANVRLTRNADSLVLTADEDGLAGPFNLDTGTYALAISASGHSYTQTSQSITAARTVTANMTAIVIAQSDNPEVRAVAFDSGAFGGPAVANLTYTILESGVITRDKIYEKGRAVSVKTDTNGRNLQDLYVNTRHRIDSVECNNLKAEFVVPETHSTWLVYDLIADTAAAEA